MKQPICKESLSDFKLSTKQFSSCLCRHPHIQKYASKEERYLKTPSIKKRFEALYNDKCDEEKIEKNKRKLNRQTRLISQSEVALEDRNSLLELEGQLSNTESSSEAELTLLPTTSSAKIEMRNIKELIFSHAKELYHLYQRGDDLSTEQLEAMSKGLSCILDLGEPEKEGTLRCLFSDDFWTKYANRFKTAPSVIDKS